MVLGRKITEPKNCFTCQTRSSTEWCVLDDTELALLNSAKKHREYLPGEAIYHEGDPANGVYCLESGMAGIRKIDANGNSVLLRLAYPGDTMAYQSFLVGGEHPNGAEALQPTVACFIDRTTVRAMLEVNPALGLRFLQHAARDLQGSDDKVMQGVTLTVRARFAHLLLVLLERFGSETEDGSTTLTLPLSRQDMAAMIGVRPESMSRTIRSLEDDGIASFSGRIVRVPEIDGLINMVKFGDEF